MRIDTSLARMEVSQTPEGHIDYLGFVISLEAGPPRSSHKDLWQPTPELC